MKLQCDGCSKEEASVYCPADEASLCAACDHRVHHANKLAQKHPRFSLISPTPKDSPPCDICKEKRAFLFCQQDRAILCKDCDVPIHNANEYTKKHHRFLLTGVKLSATSALYTESSSSANSITNGCDLVPEKPNCINNIKPVSVSPAAAAIPNPPAIQKSVGKMYTQFVDGSGYGSNNTSSISEYLIEMLPGWRVEDLLDAPSPFCKSIDSDVMPFWDGGDLLEGNMNSFSSENMGMWVPQALPATAAPPSQQYNLPNSNMIGFGGQMGGGSKAGNTISRKSSRKWLTPDDGFTVPQISPPSTNSKRSRTLW